MRSRRTKSNAGKLPESARLQQDPHDRQSTRLRLGNYVADIVPDHVDDSVIYRWIVQRTGSSQVLRLGQETTLAEALACGHRWLERLPESTKHGPAQSMSRRRLLHSRSGRSAG